MKKTATKPANLPTFETAQRELMVREARSFAWMLVRLVCVAFLVTIITRNIPGLKPFRIGFDAIGGILILAPLFTSLGRTFAWRIALGKAYNDTRQFENTEKLLKVLSGLRAKLFDANGEGRYYRAIALHQINQSAEAMFLFQEIVQQGRIPWSEQAKAELEALSEGSKVSGRKSASTL